MNQYRIYLAMNSIFLLLFFLGCTNGSNSKKYNGILSADNSKYIPSKTGDTFLYVGYTHYSDVLDNFDTSYSDSIRVFQLSADSFYYLMKQIKYKEIPPVNNIKDEKITVVELYDRFAINDSNEFRFEYISEYFKQKTLVKFGGADSIYFYEVIDRASEGKREHRVFKGRRL